MSKNPQNRSKNPTDSRKKGRILKMSANGDRKPEGRNSSPFLKKFRLYEMALNGKRRPKLKGKSLRDALAKYTAHDPDFHEVIKSLVPHWFGGNKADAKKIELIPGDRKATPSFKTVIQRMTNAHRNPGNPAYKAHATRALEKYATARATEIGSTPTRVAAGVRASFTKRMAKA